MGRKRKQLKGQALDKWGFCNRNSINGHKCITKYEKTYTESAPVQPPMCLPPDQIREINLSDYSQKMST